MIHSWTEKGEQILNSIQAKHNVKFSVAEKLLLHFSDEEYIDRAIENKYPFAKKIAGIGRKTEKKLHT